MEAGPMQGTHETTERAHVMHPRLERLLALLVEWDGSDLHLQAGSGPRIRVNGRLRKVPGELPLTSVETEEITRTILTREATERFDNGREVDFSAQHPE